MSHEKGYGGIDRFRIAAAVLVVAIHTLPLRMFGVLPHVVLSGIITRLGVPFFLAATGFFLLTPFADNPRSDPRRIGRFALKAAVLYAVCIIIYLPVNLYAGHFADISSVWQALKMALVDGTMYHLWYLPAVILAVPLVWALLRFTPLKITAAAVIFLYIIGLFGDSYYGLSASAPFFKGFYQVVFTVSDYTRSGLFYAPVFLLAGVCASRLQSMPRKKSGTGFLVSFALMLAEGLILHFADIQRHDSMYIMLPACTLFLLIWLSSFNGASKRSLRSVSMLVYIIHPGAIVLIRGAAKLTGLEHPLIDNSLIHFAAVCTLSFAAVAALAVLANAFKALKAPLQRRAWVEIDLGALSHNVRTLKSLLPPDCKLMPAVKADAYGFGAARISKELNRLGVRDFCVASPAEGIELRKCGIRGNILILGYTHPDDCRLIKRYRLVQTVVDNRHGALLAEKNMDMPVHIKLDTGMRRLGERIEHTDKIAELFGLAGIKICGIYTQFPCSDSALPQDIEQTRAQLGSFEAVLEGLSSRGIDLPKRHMQCSYGIKLPRYKGRLCPSRPCAVRHRG